MADWANEGGHFYNRDGTPAYTIEGKNGIERQTHVGDARRLGLVPGATTIIRCAAQPGLERWKRDKKLLSGLTLPRLPDESETAWLVRVEKDWQEEAKQAAERGTAIHAAIEKHYRGEPVLDLWDWVQAAKSQIEHACGHPKWRAERSFADPRGYGGKTDLHSGEWVIDIKSKEGDVGASDPEIFDEHRMQLAAYREGLGIPGARGAILFVGRDVPSACFIEVQEANLDRGWSMFCALLAYWKAKNRFE